MLLYNRVNSDPRVKKAWTWNSHVYVMDQGDKVHQIGYEQTLDDVLSSKKKITGNSTENNELSSEVIG